MTCDDSDTAGQATCARAACLAHPGLTFFPSLMLSSSSMSDAKVTPPSNRRRSLKFFLHLPTSLSSPDAGTGNDVPAPSNTNNSSSSPLTTAHLHVPPDIILTIAAMLPSTDILSFSMTVRSPPPCPPVTETLSYHANFLYSPLHSAPSSPQYSTTPLSYALAPNADEHFSCSPSAGTSVATSANWWYGRTITFRGLNGINSLTRSGCP